MVNKVAEGKVREGNCETNFGFVAAYLCHLLFLIHQDIVLDVTTLENVKSITANLDQFNTVEGQT